MRLAQLIQSFNFGHINDYFIAVLLSINALVVYFKERIDADLPSKSSVVCEKDEYIF